MSEVAANVAPRSAGTGAPSRISQRVASIDWMRGAVMVFMVLDHASMAFDAGHLDKDSAMYAGAGTMALPGFEFFTRWLTHLCAPAFVFLMGTALALSVERKVVKGVNAWQIDKDMLVRGTIIALLDPTLISLGSGRWTFQVLLAIGLSMICMVPLRHLATWALLSLAVGWMVLGEIVTGWFWKPPGNSSVLAAFAVANYGGETMIIKYPLVPWLAVSIQGWVFGRHLIRFAAGQSKVSGRNVLLICGVLSLFIFVVVRGIGGYGTNIT